MRSVKSIFFESKVRLEKTTEDGTQAKFNELYAVDAVSFTDCEAKVTEHVSNYANGEFEILTEQYAKYKEIFFSDKEDEMLWYKVTLDFITIDERSGKEKHSKNVFLVQGSSVESARKNTEEMMGGTMVDYRILGLTETTIQDIIQ